MSVRSSLRFALPAVLLTAMGGTARAAAIESTACGSSSANWNAPDGALVLSRSQGPIGGTLSGVGEYRTHSMLAHGNGWVTHATMFSPSTTGWPTYCSAPLDANELQNGYPGVSIVPPGGIYAFLYGDGGSVEHIGFQRSCNSAGCPNDDGSDIANWTWSSSPYEWVASRQDGNQGIYRLLKGTPSLPISYSLYQYRNLEDISTGGSTWNNGAVCSTFLAYAQYMADKRPVTAFTYSHSAIVSAMNGLMGAVESDCRDGIGFWKNIAVNITCFENICDDAARQPRPPRRLERPSLGRLSRRKRRERLGSRCRAGGAVELGRKRLRLLVLKKHGRSNRASRESGAARRAHLRRHLRGPAIA
jgi:hypothetical protein